MSAQHHNSAQGTYLSQSKMRQAAILASKFFQELADLFEQGQEAGLEKRQRLSENGHAVTASNHASEKQTGASSANGKDPSLSKSKALSKKEGGETASKKKTKASKAAAKDGSVVKKPLTAYMLYNNFRRSTLKLEHPEFSIIDISKVIGAEWNAMPDAQKQTWKEKANDLKLDYKIEVCNQKKINEASGVSQGSGTYAAQERSMKELKVKKEGKSSTTKLGDKRSHDGMAVNASANPSKLIHEKQVNDSSSITSLSDNMDQANTQNQDAYSSDV
uniref:HMG box domain-containing protein n=2 Tax=Strombidium rassoulzadegani TaxID=1082188 RepID=A0A7S3FZ13_9SPIT|mmetsp:Transcript_3853/g.6549  ORF Transcript_3853/g.6549 Transcript_3853/m.6549 type:complete len:275 (+) Transcript_3853:572-1396(+)|eukprot:CAMPEP_0168611302 /NCGR_PEP_ID=MMETSP0449_2-20121227/2288_1 /TAXON_ID=1082188 /ORGANISM="Strombidium rassoulzadegani, Strain ras09" /LENGTH=274 /DNA_ID=CAMNT_0008651745 /DNA_START=458 /DNA_END=1282 /DNA_ORIENTATION=-